MSFEGGRVRNFFYFFFFRQLTPPNSPLTVFLASSHKRSISSNVESSGFFPLRRSPLSTQRKRCANRRLALRRASSADRPLKRPQFTRGKRRSPNSPSMAPAEDSLSAVFSSPNSSNIFFQTS